MTIAVRNVEAVNCPVRAHIERLRPSDAPLFDIKQQWHRRVHQDPRVQWLRAQIDALFRPVLKTRLGLN